MNIINIPIGLQQFSYPNCSIDQTTSYLTCNSSSNALPLLNH